MRRCSTHALECEVRQPEPTGSIQEGSMGFKLIAMDLDRTLNNDQKAIDPPTLEALMAAQQAGVRLALASARPLPGLYKERDALRMQEHGGF